VSWVYVTSAVALMLQTCIWKVPGSKTDRHIHCTEVLPWFTVCRKIPEQCLNRGMGCFDRVYSVQHLYIRKFQVLLTDDGGRPPKHVAANIIRKYICFVGASSRFFLMK
jgi:hypothetical protein